MENGKGGGMRGVGCGMRNEGDYTIPLWVFDIEKQALYNSVVRFWAFYLTVVALNWHFVVEISEKYSFRRESFQHQCWVLSDFSTAFNSPLWGERKSIILLFCRLRTEKPPSQTARLRAASMGAWRAARRCGALPCGGVSVVWRSCGARGAVVVRWCGEGERV